MEGTQENQRVTSCVPSLVTSKRMKDIENISIKLICSVNGQDEPNELGDSLNKSSARSSKVEATPRKKRGEFDPIAERNALFPIMKLIKELDHDNKKKLDKKVEEMCNVYKDMKQFADQMTIAFETKEELVLYYSITDNLNNII
jgi:hypothetical protein